MGGLLYVAHTDNCVLTVHVEELFDLPTLALKARHLGGSAFC